MIIAPAGAAKIQPAREPFGTPAGELRMSSAYSEPSRLASSGPISRAAALVARREDRGAVLTCAHGPADVSGLQASTT